MEINYGHWGAGVRSSILRPVATSSGSRWKLTSPLYKRGTECPAVSGYRMSPWAKCWLEAGWKKRSGQRGTAWEEEANVA